VPALNAATSLSPSGISSASPAVGLLPRSRTDGGPAPAPVLQSPMPPMFKYHPLTQRFSPAKGLEVQVHHLISLGGWNDVIHLSIYLPCDNLKGTLIIIILVDCMTPALLCLCPCLYTPVCHCHISVRRAACTLYLVIHVCYFTFFFLYSPYLSCETMSRQKLPLQRHLPPATSITSPAPSRTTLHGYTASSTTNFVIRGSNIDSTGVGGILYREGHSSL
jgi:hypothetical protein